MPIGFRLEIAAPRTNTREAFSKKLTATESMVQRVDIALKKEKGKISTLTAELFDPRLKLLDELPDPAFFDVGVKLYLAKPGQPSSVSVKTFDGIATSYDLSSWVQGRWLLVAHDNSYKARVRALQRTFTNKTSLDLVKLIAREYGWEVDTSALSNTRTLEQRLFSIGLPASGDKFYSDWDHLQRELLSDGLTAHVKHNKLIIHRAPQTAYSRTFRPGDGYFIDLAGSIRHVRGPGGQGNISSQVAYDHAGAEKALKGKPKQAAEAMQGGDGKTHIRPVGGASTKTQGAHSEDTKGASWSNEVNLRRKRKDEATLTLNVTPDLFLDHLVPLDGVSSKYNGQWEPIEIRHAIVPSSESHTTVAMQRGVNRQAAAQSGTVAFAYSELR